VLLLILIVPCVNAEVPDIVLKQKNTVVIIYVDDKNGNHIVSGSGFIVDQNGVIVTNCNVIVKWFEEVGNTLNVKMEGGIHFSIEDLISSKCENNLALFKIEANGLPAVKLAADYKPGKGENIFVIGSLSGLENTISHGSIRSVREKDKFIQISIPVTKEKSGSPVFNIKGEAIGAATFLPKKSKDLNFAVPLNGVIKQLDRYRKLGKKSVKIDTPSPIYTPSTKPLTETKTMEIIPPLAKGGKGDYQIKEAEKDSDSANAHFLRGCSYDELNMNKEAIKAYQQSVRIKPAFAEAYVNLGLAYYRLGKYTDAINAYKKALQIKPNSSSLYNKLGATYIINGKYSIARDTFKKAIDIDPNDAVAHYNLGVAYFLNGETNAAFREYIILKDLDKERAKSLVDLIY
jgi:Tfp pilus assembly protein PilF